jgi:hypothetical protein
MAAVTDHALPVLWKPAAEFGLPPSVDKTHQRRRSRIRRQPAL